MNFEDRQRNNAFGKFAEDIACEYYVANGYALRERNWRIGKSEIDLILQKDNIIVVVEVKARKGDFQNAIEAVSKDKIRRMLRAADSYLRYLEGDYEYRFDIFALTGDENNYHIEVIKDAFLAPLI